MARRLCVSKTRSEKTLVRRRGALSMRAVLLLAAVLGCAGQAAEWSTYDASVAALCGAEGSANTTLTDADIVQTTGTKVRVTAPGNPDAVWVKDGYGMILTYSANPTLPIELDFGTEALELKLFAHYSTTSTCYTSSSNPVQTWRQEYNDYVSSDAGTYSSNVSSYVAAAAKPVRGRVSSHALLIAPRISASPQEARATRTGSGALISPAGRSGTGRSARPGAPRRARTPPPPSQRSLSLFSPQCAVPPRAATPPRRSSRQITPQRPRRRR